MISYNVALFLCGFTAILTALGIMAILFVAASRWSSPKSGEPGPSRQSAVAFFLALAGSFLGPLIVPIGTASIALSALELRRVRLGRSPMPSRLLAQTAIALCLCMFASLGIMTGLLAMGGVIR